AAPTANTQEAERRALLEFGRQQGITNPTTGNITKKPWVQTLESWLEKLPVPGVGGKVADVNQAQRNSWQNAIIKGAGGGNETAAPPNVVERLVNGAGQRIGNAINNQSLRVDPEVGKAFDQVEKEYGKQLLSTIRPGIMDQIQELRG